MLILREAAGAPRRIPITQSLRIGRGPANELVLASPEISRQHCVIDLDAGLPAITDLGSTNGVYVDDVRVGATLRLHPGARITIGPYSLVYAQGSSAEIDRAEAEQRDQARAVSYVRALLPPPLEQGPVRAAWHFEPSAQIGGDAFGYRWLDDARFAAFLLDVSGHGAGPALLAASAANMLRAASLAADLADPVATLQALNATFQGDDHDGLLFSLWYGVFHRPSRALRFATAGHHPAFLQHEGRLTPLVGRGPCIGMVPNASFQPGEAAIPPGARLHLFSDGAFETTRAYGSPGSLAAMLPLLPGDGDSASAPDRLLEALRQDNGRRPFEDDVSLLSLDFT